MSENQKIDLYAKPLIDMAAELQDIYERFNWNLFDQQLPNCMISLKRHSSSSGYFNIGNYDRKDGTFSDEIILNPALYDPENPLDFLGVLVHQMVHIDQKHFGQPGRGGYHNRQWADKMIEIGLQPTSTGLEGGRETGDSVLQIIMPNGKFEKAALELTRSGDLLTWKEREIPQPSLEHGNISNDSTSNPEVEPKSGKRVRYICPQEECKQAAESTHDARIKCEDHDLRMLSVPRKKRRPLEGRPK